MSAEDYQDCLAAHNVACRMSRTGNCYANAVMEAFFSTLKTELADSFASHGQAKRERSTTSRRAIALGDDTRPSTASVPPNSSAASGRDARDQRREVIPLGPGRCPGARFSREPLRRYPFFSAARIYPMVIT